MLTGSIRFTQSGMLARMASIVPFIMAPFTIVSKPGSSVSPPDMRQGPS